MIRPMGSTLLLLPIDLSEVYETRAAADRLIREYVAYMGRASTTGLCTCEVVGNSMASTINDGDTAIFDKMEKPANGSIVVATIDGQYLIKRFLRDQPRTILLSDNHTFPPIEATRFNSFVIVGTVRALVREVKQNINRRFFGL